MHVCGVNKSKFEQIPFHANENMEAQRMRENPIIETVRECWIPCYINAWLNACCKPADNFIWNIE